MKEQRTTVIVEGPDLPPGLPALVFLRGMPIVIVDALELVRALDEHDVSLVVICQAYDIHPARRALAKAGSQAALVLLSTHGLTPFVDALESGMVSDVVVTSVSEEEMADRLVLLEQRARSCAIVAPGLRRFSSRQSAPPPPDAPTTSRAALPRAPNRSALGPASGRTLRRASAPPPPLGALTRSASPPPPLAETAEPAPPSLSSLPTLPWQPPPRPATAVARVGFDEFDETESEVSGSATLDGVEGLVASTPPTMLSSPPRPFAAKARRWGPWAAAGGLVITTAVLAPLLLVTPAASTSAARAEVSASQAQLSEPGASSSRSDDDAPAGQQARANPNAAAATPNAAATTLAPTDLEQLPTAERDPLFWIEPVEHPGCSALLADWTPATDTESAERTGRLAYQHRRRGQAHLLAGRDAEAETELCKSVAYAPAGPGTKLLADQLLTRHATAEARKVLETALDEAPGDPGYLELLGDAFSQLGLAEEARRRWLAALQIHESNESRQIQVARHWIRSAVHLRRAGAHARAERLLRRAVTFDPQNATAALLLSQVLERQGQVELAKTWYDRGRQLDE